MNDTLPVKDLAMATVGATQLPGTARSFPRTFSSDGSYKRTSAHIGSLSPTTIRVSHQPRKTTTAKQRSLFALDQTLTRLDASSNPILVTDFTVAFQVSIPGDVTLAEYRTAVSTLCGALLESDGALITSLYNGEF